MQYIVYLSSSLELKWPGHEADHLPSFSTEVKNERSCTSIPTCAFMVCTGATLFYYTTVD